jgi:hypothetical protein
MSRSLEIISRSRAIIIPAGLTLFVLGCTVVPPNLTEKGKPTLQLNLVDLNNPANNQQNLPPAHPKKVDNGVEEDMSLNSNYNYVFMVVATDSGGLASMGYSSQFLSFGGCNPNSDYGVGTSVNQPAQALPKTNNGSVPTQWNEFIGASAQAEWKYECGNSPYTGSDLAGVYIITGTATNYAGHTATATWYVNIGPEQQIPTGG